MLIDKSDGTTKTYYFQRDDLNTVHALLDHNGTAVERYDYSAYGETRILDSNGQTLMVDDDLDEEFDLDHDGIIDIGYPREGELVTPRVIASQSQFDNPFGYAGMRRDEHSGLYHTHYREYNPNLGRWLTPDPAGYKDGQNLYAYYPNVNGVDPLGLWGVQFGDTNIGWGQPSIAFGEGNHVTGEVGFVQGLSQGAEDTLYGRDRNLSSDLAVGMTPAGLVHDTIDIGYGVDYLRKGQYLAGSLQMAGGLIGIVPIAGDLIKIPLKRGASALAKETTQQIVKEGTQRLSSEVTENTVKRSAYKGGRHGDMKNPVGDGLDSHHMPADSISPVPRENGPAIQMDPVDHKLTSSYGGGMEAIEYRVEIQNLLQNKGMRSAIAQEIFDVRRAAREGSSDATKYNQAIREMLDYAKTQKYINK